VDVIVTNGTAAPTVKQQTSVIPIVFPMGIDPLGGDLITNLARPGGNVTGLSSQQSDLAGKRLELLREVAPRSPSPLIAANHTGGDAKVRVTIGDAEPVDAEPTENGIYTIPFPHLARTGSGRGCLQRHGNQW
jgi:ABC transporter substrate binding protein